MIRKYLYFHDQKNKQTDKYKSIQSPSKCSDMCVNWRKKIKTTTAADVTRPKTEKLDDALMTLCLYISF